MSEATDQPIIVLVRPQLGENIGKAARAMLNFGLTEMRLVEPRDGAWSLGAWAMGVEGWDREAIFNHLRSWAVKAFFLAFMVAIVPPGFAEFVSIDPLTVLRNPVALAMYCVTFMFVVDVAFATAGYILTLRPLDSHIRTANPYAGAWAVALICYPPFIMMGEGRPLNYHPGTMGENGWIHWLDGYPAGERPRLRAVA